MKNKRYNNVQIMGVLEQVESVVPIFGDEGDGRRKLSPETHVCGDEHANRFVEGA